MNRKMNLSEKTVRRGLYGMFAGGLLAFGSAAIVIPVANSAPDSCSASGVATTSSTVSASTSTYLTSHPETNQRLTDISKQPEDQAMQAYRAYFTDNPQVKNELTQINQPVMDLASQCGINVTPTPVSEALQGL
jgi:heme-binding protein